MTCVCAWVSVPVNGRCGEVLASSHTSLHPASACTCPLLSNPSVTPPLPRNLLNHSLSLPLTVFSHSLFSLTCGAGSIIFVRRRSAVLFISLTRATSCGTFFASASFWRFMSRFTSASSMSCCLVCVVCLVCFLGFDNNTKWRHRGGGVESCTTCSCTTGTAMTNTRQPRPRHYSIIPSFHLLQPCGLVFNPQAL